VAIGNGVVDHHGGEGKIIGYLNREVVHEFVQRRNPVARPIVGEAHRLRDQDGSHGSVSSSRGDIECSAT